LRTIWSDASFSYFTILEGNNHPSGLSTPIRISPHFPVTALLYPPSGTFVLVGSTIASRRFARSRTDLVIGPAESASRVTGMMPSCDTILRVGLIVYRADRSLGMMSDPIVSVPIEMGEKPAATATAEPEEEPPGFYNFSLATPQGCPAMSINVHYGHRQCRHCGIHREHLPTVSARPRRTSQNRQIPTGTRPIPRQRRLGLEGV
jgi:hypothetical protein